MPRAHGRLGGGPLGGGGAQPGGSARLPPQPPLPALVRPRRHDRRQHGDHPRRDPGVPEQRPGRGLRPARRRPAPHDLDRCRVGYTADEYAGQRCVMGVDVGTVLHVVVREPRPRKGWMNPCSRLWFAGEVQDFAALGRLMVKYHVTRCVIDALPETHAARTFAEDYSYVHLAYYVPSTRRSGLPGTATSAATSSAPRPWTRCSRAFESEVPASPRTPGSSGGASGLGWASTTARCSRRCGPWSRTRTATHLTGATDGHLAADALAVRTAPLAEKPEHRVERRPRPVECIGTHSFGGLLRPSALDDRPGLFQRKVLRLRDAQILRDFPHLRIDRDRQRLQ